MSSCSAKGYSGNTPYPGTSTEICEDCMLDGGCGFCQVSGRCLTLNQGQASKCPVTNQTNVDTDGTTLRYNDCRWQDDYSNSLHTIEVNVIYPCADSPVRVLDVHPSLTGGTWFKNSAEHLTISLPSDATALEICVLPDWAGQKSMVDLTNLNLSPGVSVSSLSQPPTLDSCRWSQYSTPFKVILPSGNERGTGNVTLASLKIKSWPHENSYDSQGVAHTLTVYQYNTSQHCPSITPAIQTPTGSTIGGTPSAANPDPNATPSSVGRNGGGGGGGPTDNSGSIVAVVVASLCFGLVVVLVFVLYRKKQNKSSGNSAIELMARHNKQRQKSRTKYNGYKGGAVQVVLHDDDEELPGISKENWTKQLVSSLGGINMSMLIDFNAITMGKKIAAGGGGQVYTAIWRNTPVVVKEPFWFVGTSSSELIHEIQMLSELDHPNIVQFFGVSHSERRVYIVTELCEMGSLNSWLSEGRFPAKESFYPCAIQLMNTLHWLHEVGVVHRDIKPHNVLMCEMNNTLSLKLCDLGTAREQSQGMSMTANVGTISYTPPEVMSSKRAIYDGRKWDVYSASLCLYYMYTGQRPFGSKSNFEIISGVANGNGLRPVWVECNMPHELWHMLESMWEEEPDHRPLSDQVASILEQVDPNESRALESGSSSSSDEEEGNGKEKEKEKESALPPSGGDSDWTAHYDANHQTTFYHHKKTRRTTWTNPNEGGAAMNENPMHR